MTEKGRELAVAMTGGGGPPRVPVKDRTLSPAAVGSSLAQASVVVEVADWTAVLGIGLVTIMQELVAVAAASPVPVVAVPPPATGRPLKSMLVGSMTPVPVKVGVTSSTAARTSSGEASRTSSLSVKMHPGKSSAVSQLFPAPVASFTSPS